MSGGKTARSKRNVLECRDNNVFNDERCGRAKNSPCKRTKKLERAVAFLISFIFGTFFTLIIEALFF